MAVATITSKGQMTLPKAIRERLGLKPGDQVELTPTEDGLVTMRARRRRPLSEVLGTLPNNGVRLTIEEMDEAIAQAVTERFMRGR
jgi:antitoxin PrlF